MRGPILLKVLRTLFEHHVHIERTGRFESDCHLNKSCLSVSGVARELNAIKIIGRKPLILKPPGNQNCSSGVGLMAVSTVERPADRGGSDQSG